jgi:thiol-disulfide isomerase/thioredoxin
MNLATLALLSIVLQPQAPSTPAQSPQDCIKSAREFAARRFKELGPATSATARQVSEERLAMLRECAARYDVDRTPVEGLPTLVELLIEAQQPEAAQKALTRALAAPDLATLQRGNLLAHAVRMLLRQPKSADRNAAAEKYVDQIDALGDAALEPAIVAHSQMNGYYRADDIDNGIIKHSNWLIDTGRRLSPDLRRKYGHQIVSAYDNLAEAVAGQAENDRALAILNSAKTDWPEMADDVNRTLERYLTVGKDAPAVVGDTWLNNPSSELPLKGRVTLLQFTAHWCGPCKESYPGMKRLADRFANEPFQLAFFTQLYGYFGSEQKLAAAQEIERDREYYGGYGFKIPIAIGARGVEEAYKVGGIPQIVAIDKAGKIRLIMIGYDDANEEKLAAFIKSLIAEK